MIRHIFVLESKIVNNKDKTSQTLYVLMRRLQRKSVAQTQTSPVLPAAKERISKGNTAMTSKGMLPLFI